MIDIKCSKCGQPGKVPEKFQGRSVKCGKCGTSLPVPAVRRRSSKRWLVLVPVYLLVLGAAGAGAYFVVMPRLDSKTTPEPDQAVADARSTTGPERPVAEKQREDTNLAAKKKTDDEQARQRIEEEKAETERRKQEAAKKALEAKLESERKEKERAEEERKGKEEQARLLLERRNPKLAANPEDVDRNPDAFYGKRLYFDRVKFKEGGIDKVKDLKLLHCRCHQLQRQVFLAGASQWAVLLRTRQAGRHAHREKHRMGKRELPAAVLQHRQMRAQEGKSAAGKPNLQSGGLQPDGQPGSYLGRGGMNTPALRHWFAQPLLLWLMFVLPMLTVLAFLAKRRQRRVLARFGRLPALAALTERRRPWLFVRSLCWTLGITALVAGLAGPRWGREEKPSTAPGRDLVVLLDLSRSMLADDVVPVDPKTPPSRQQQAKEALRKLVRETLQKHGGNRVALVGFAARAAVICPLTHDYDHFCEKLAELDAAQLPLDLRPAETSKSGTRIGQGLRLAVETHDPRFRGFQDILMISDGDDPLARDGEWRAGLEAAKEAAVPVYTVGIGNPTEGGKIPTLDGHSLMHDDREVITHLRPRLLQEIAKRTKGTYTEAGVNPPRLGELFRGTIEGGPKRGCWMMHCRPTSNGTRGSSARPSSSWPWR